MSHLVKRQYLIAIYDCYQSNLKYEKSRILDEFYVACGYNRKSASRLLNNPMTETHIHGRGRIFSTKAIL